MIRWGQPGSGLTPAPDLKHTVEYDDCPDNVPERLTDRFAIREINLKNGLVLCECGRFKPIPKDKLIGEPSFWRQLYLCNAIQFFMIRPGEEHECDPKWIKAELIKARATIDKRNKKLQEMQVGLQRLRDKLK